MSDHLILLDGETTIADHPLRQAKMELGSDPACPIQHASWPARAAVLERIDGTWTLRQREGVVAQDGRTAPRVALVHGEVVTLGGIGLRLRTSRVVIERTVNSGKDIGDPVAMAAALATAAVTIRREVAKVVIGQDEVVRQLLIALFAQGHCLLVGAPGLAKTLLARTVAGCCDLTSKRVQFTPDLMPSDITGSEVLEDDDGRRRFTFRQGPVFTNLLLADEINRAPPKTQASLLEAMQERRVTAGGTTWNLPRPFLVMATQNPIEQEGTYPLPEAQLDRFMFSIAVGYPDADDERRIIQGSTGDHAWEVERVLSGEDILAFQRLVRLVPVSDHVATYATALVRASRPEAADADPWIKRHVRWGAGPRAGQFLLLAAKARALLEGDGNVSCADVRAFALPVLRHRVFVSFAAAAEGVDADAVVAHLLKTVEEPRA